MENNVINLILADDDVDDCLFFKEALEGLPFVTSLIIAHDGEELMRKLSNHVAPPLDVLFLDLNMPRKNGYECLSEIKQNKTMAMLPIIIFSTSFDQEIANTLYEQGAHYYIRKPSDFAPFKNIIHRALSLLSEDQYAKPPIEKFVLNANF